ncbi:MAG: aspartate ammonia-lyase [Opitutales bacterium]|nr:aspartate ammonia-lyase [Opitutales bacterium]
MTSSLSVSSPKEKGEINSSNQQQAVLGLVRDYGELFTPKSGCFIAHERMPILYLDVLIEGRMNAFKASGDGLRFVRRIESGDILGAELLMDSAVVVYRETVEATMPCSIARFPKSSLPIIARENPSVYKLLKEKAFTLSGDSNPDSYREESDLLGVRQLPDSALYGIQTLRAYENFPISGTPVSHYPGFIAALAMVKLACAQANRDLDLLDEPVFKAICKSCKALIKGRHHRHFIVDVLQGGAGTSTNMMANEVIASLAQEELGASRGDVDAVHPNNHVNLSQSTNDVYPTAFRIAARIGLRRLRQVLNDLAAELELKALEFNDVIKMGRTQLQDAVPMTLGQEFSAYAYTLREDLLRLEEADALLREINMGATAIGTGINAPRDFGHSVCTHLKSITGLDLKIADNLIEATQDTGAYVQLSSVLKRVAIKLSKICNDLRLLSSGPRAGLNEIQLPDAQPGSSIMPGKVNPVIPEVVNQVAFEVSGNDVTITMAAEAGQLQLNAMEPVIFWSLFKSIHHLRQAIVTFHHRCVKGIKANKDVSRNHAENSIGLITALAPMLGYSRTSKLARQALVSGKSARSILEEEGLLSKKEIASILDLRRLAVPDPNR